jgi:hypothetical protein
MLRQLGPFTIFYTFSVVDMKWPEFLRCLSKTVDNIEISLEEAAALLWKTRARLVRSDPVTSTRYHRHRMESLLSTMKKYPSVSGEIVDFFGEMNFSNAALLTRIWRCTSKMHLFWEFIRMLEFANLRIGL